MDQQDGNEPEGADTPGEASPDLTATAKPRRAGYANYGPGVRSGKPGRSAKLAPTPAPRRSAPATARPTDPSSAAGSAPTLQPRSDEASGPGVAADAPAGVPPGADHGAPTVPPPLLESPHNLPPQRPGSAAGPFIVPAPVAAPLPLVGSIALGLAAGVVAASAWFLFTITTKTILVLLGFFVGAIIGIGFAYHADRSTRIVRGVIAVAWTSVSLFFATYFTARQALINELANRGLLDDVTVRVLASPSTMFHMVGGFFSANTVTYAVWAGALYVAWVIPGSKLRPGTRRT